MTDDCRLWVRHIDVPPDIDVAAGRHLVIGDDDADPKVARIVAIDGGGNLQLEVLPGTVESHLDLLAQA